MARRRIVMSMFIAGVITYALGNLYRQYLGTRFGALADLVVWGALTAGIVSLFRRFED